MRKYFFSILSVLAVAIMLTGCDFGKGEAKKVTGIEKIKAAKVLKVGVDTEDFPPFAMHTGGNLVGFDIDICYDIAKKMGVKLEIKEIPFTKLLPAIEKGDIDLGLAAFTITPKRNMDVLFSQPYIVGGQALLIDKTLKDKIFSYRDLNSTSYVVAYNKGTTAEDAAKKLLPDSRFKEVQSEGAGVEAIIKKEANALIADLSYCSTAMAKDGGEHLAIIDETMTFEPTGMAINRADYHLLNWVNNYIQQIQSDGTYDEFYTKWFKKTDWVKYLK